MKKRFDVIKSGTLFYVSDTLTLKPTGKGPFDVEVDCQNCAEEMNAVWEALEGSTMNNETTASQPKSIGDDAQFFELVKNVAVRYGSFMEGVNVQGFLAANAGLNAYVDHLLDSRAPVAQASATIYQVDMDNGNWGDTDKPHFDNFKGEKRIVYSSATIQAAPDNISVKVRAIAEKWNSTAIKEGFAGNEVAYELLAALGDFDDATIQEPVMVAEPVERAQTGAAVAKVYVQDNGRAGVVWLRGFKPVAGMGLYASQLADSSKSAAPMVADPAGVAGISPDDRLVSIHDGEHMQHSAYGEGIFFTADCLREVPLAATAKAVPSEEPSGAPAELLWVEVNLAAVTANKAFGQWMPQRWLEEFVKAYNFEVRATKGLGAAPLADKTGGGE